MRKTGEPDSLWRLGEGLRGNNSKVAKGRVGKSGPVEGRVFITAWNGQELGLLQKRAGGG